MTNLNRRTFGATIATGLAATAVNADSGEEAVGPMIGHVSESSAILWFRPSDPGRYELRVTEQHSENTIVNTTESRSDDDRCVKWEISDLKPATQYRYEIHHDGSAIASDASQIFSTAPAENTKVKTCLAFGSCAESGPLKLWSQMAEHGADGLVLLGDTPYIDTLDLGILRAKHREFLSIPQLAAFGKSRPVWGTWDDHDFGLNDSDGRLKGKERSRKAFMEYRANQSFGHDDQGIYTKFRRGGVEVFLLDTRWFARTEPSPVDPEKPTLLGKRQWAWLKQGLEESTAPFKVIACGMIWDDKENRESDDWGTYHYERQGLFDFLGEKNISGVVLIGGDIHCSRWLEYKTNEQVGYPIRQFIVSPIHNRVIPTLNVAHPDLIKGAAIPNVWLRLEVDTGTSPATLHARWMQMNGRKMWDVMLTEDDLSKS